MEKPQTSRLGVSALDAFFSECGWLFREQTVHDFGIDAHVEIVSDGLPTGKLVAIQVKSGVSFFREEDGDCYVFRTDEKHAAYWTAHSMPVIVVLYNPVAKTAHWQHLSGETMEQAGKQWRAKIPKANMFEDRAQCLRRIAALAQPEPYIRRLNRLRVDRFWIDMLNTGHEVCVEFSDWVNKSLSRYQVTISCGKWRQTWPTLYMPGGGIDDMLTHLLPWADVEMDLEAHKENSREVWENECYGWRDQETGDVYYTEDFSEWYGRQECEGIRPVAEDGETATYSLLLSLNDLGKSFLLLDDYLSDSSAHETMSFTLD